MNISQVLRGHGIGVGKKSTGNAVAGDLLSGKTATTAAGDITGTMVDRGAVTLTPGASTVAIAQGYHNGSGVVSAVSNLSAGNIKATATVGGVAGTFSSDATVSAGDMKSGITGYKNGAIVTGTMPVKSADYGAPSSGADGRIYITPDAAYHNGTARVYADDADFTPKSFLDNKNIYGLQGSIPLKTNVNGDGGPNWHLATDVSPVSGTGVFLRKWNPADPSTAMAFAGDCWLEAADADFVESNIRSGISLFGLPGSLVPGAPNAKGVISSSSSGIVTVTGLSFAPKVIVIYKDGASGTSPLGIYTVAGHMSSSATSLTYDNGSLYNNKFTSVTSSGFTWDCTIAASFNFQWVAYG